MTSELSIDFRSSRPGLSVYYGWVNLAVAALAMVATLPGRTLGLGLIAEPMMRDLRLSRETFAWMNLWATLIGASFSLLCGPLIDRQGVRRVLVLNLALLGLAVLLMCHVSSPWLIAILLTLTRGLGQSALSVVSLAVVGKWFVKRINMAMAVFSASVAFGFIIAIPSLQYAAEHSHWRTVWSGIGWALLIGLTPAAFALVRRTPESFGVPPDHFELQRTQGADQPQPDFGFTLSQTLREPMFWVFALSAAMFNLIFAGVSLFSEAILRERGFYDAGTFRAAMGVLALGGILSNFVGGYLASRMTLSRLMSGAMLIMMMALLILPLAKSQSMVVLYAGLMGAAGGVVTVVFFACWPGVFGRAHLGRIQGAAQVLTVLASAAGPLLLAMGEKHQGSMSAMFQIMAPAVGVLAVACWMVRLPTEANRKV